MTKNNKKTIFFALILIITVLLSSCSKQEETILKTKGMLNITNYEESFLGCRSRYESVITSITEKVVTLETEHNNQLKISYGDEYFLNDEYILSSFSPFNISTLSNSDVFSDSYTLSSVEEKFSIQNPGYNISFSENSNDYILKFISEEDAKIFEGKYNSKTDSLFYSYTQEVNNITAVQEYVGFATLSENKYIVCTHNSRCYVIYDGYNIKYLACATYKKPLNDSDEYIFNPPEINDSNAEDWIKECGSIESIRIFSNDVLSITDYSSGSKKDYMVNASDFASAFQK